MTTDVATQEQKLASTEEKASPVTDEVTEEKPSTEEQASSEVADWRESEEAKAELERVRSEGYQHGQGDRDRQVSQAEDKIRGEATASLREAQALTSAYESQLREYGEEDSFFELAGHRSKVEGAKAPPPDPRQVMGTVFAQNAQGVILLGKKHGVDVVGDDGDFLPDVDFSADRWGKDPIAETHRLADTIITRAVKAVTSTMKAEHKAELEAQAATYEAKLRDTQRVDTGEPSGAVTLQGQDSLSKISRGLAKRKQRRS